MQVQKRIYATVEITRTEFRFVVNLFKEKIGIRPLYKFCKKSINNPWLDENDNVVDIQLATKTLQEAMRNVKNEYNLCFDSVFLILPNKTVKANNHLIKVFEEKAHERPITQEEWAKLNQAVNVYTSQIKDFIISKTISKILINNNEYSIENLRNIYAAKSFKAKLNLISISQTVFSSHSQVIKNAKLNILKCYTSETAVAAFKLNKNQLFGPNVFVNYTNDSLAISFYHHHLIETINIENYSINDIVSRVANKISTDFEQAKNYLNKLLNFNNQKYDDIVCYRKKSREEKNIELKYANIKQLFIDEFTNAIKLIDNNIKNIYENLKDFYVFYNGDILDICGVQNILKESNYFHLSKANITNEVGLKQCWLNASAGAIKLYERSNKHNSVLENSTNKNNLKVEKKFVYIKKWFSSIIGAQKAI